MAKIKSILLLVCIAFLSFGISAQTSSKLKKKERELQKKIENTKSLIKSARNSQQLTIAELGIISHQITYREELVANINYQMKKLDVSIENQQKQILSLENNLKELKEEYAKILQYAFKNRNTDYHLLYIFSAKSYTEAYRRLNYIKQYAEYRQKQVERIKKTQAILQEKIEESELKKAEKADLSDIQKKEKDNFLKDQELEQKALFALKADEQKLKNELQKQERKKREVASAIKKAIEKEMAKIASASSKSGFTITPESAALSKSFTSNKGRLPWPVAKGEVTGKYGKHEHSVSKGIIVENKGIDIATVKNAEVRTVFGGKVSSIVIIPGAGKAVIISHGSYRTVYANLKEVYVTKGDQIATKDKLGVLLPAEKGNVSVAHFEIWKISSSGMATENPSLWIYR